ncbi:hypothetical protein EDB84DRAFT_1465144 [Lactarius hengduanensis]|nr:hypothetical protein EDB84DRAFT_1465144 [Lactarius hengduanensis]
MAIIFAQCFYYVSDSHHNCFSSNFRTIFVAALKAYEKNTKTDRLTHPLATQLQSCDSSSDVLAVLRDRVNEFDQSRSHDERLSSWLNPTINVLYAFTATLGEGVGLIFSPAKVISAGVGVLLLVSVFLDPGVRELPTATYVPGCQGCRRESRSPC